MSETRIEESAQAERPVSGRLGHWFLEVVKSLPASFVAAIGNVDPGMLAGEFDRKRQRVIDLLGRELNDVAETFSEFEPNSASADGEKDSVDLSREWRNIAITLPTIAIIEHADAIQKLRDQAGNRTGLRLELEPGRQLAIKPGAVFILHHDGECDVETIASLEDIMRAFRKTGCDVKIV